MLAGCLPREFPQGKTRPSGTTTAAPVQPPPPAIDPAILRERRFRESPQLAALVAEGKLPPVAARLPAEPLVVRPIDQIGVYGGRIRREVLNELLDWSAIKQSLGDNLLAFKRPVADAIELNLASGYTMSPDGKSAVFRIREGLKWSDGVPFTTDDILFWYNDTLLDKNASEWGVVSDDWLIDGEPLVMEKIDDLQLRISANAPMGMLLRRLCHYDTPVPKHYYAKFHPRYNPKATYPEFRDRSQNANWVMEPGVPRMGPWIPVKWLRGQQIVFERNPYYWKVDTAGNQLPYADELVFTVIPEPQITLLKFANGEIDLIGRNVQVASVPTLISQAEESGFRLYARRAESGASLYLNWDAEDPELRKAVRDLRVRRALSLALNREEISAIVFLGLLEPGGFAFPPSSIYHSPGAFRHGTAHDPAAARSLLEEAGYRDGDGDGFREFTDGRRFELVLDYSLGDQLGDLAELVREYWRSVGVFVHLNPGREELTYFRRKSGRFDVYVYATIAASVEPRNSPMHWGIIGANMPFWHRNAVREGPDWLRQATALMNKAMATIDEAEVRRAMAEIQQLYIENVPAIGIGAVRLPWAASNRLGNVPQDGTFANAFSGWGRGIYMEQMFIKPASR